MQGWVERLHTIFIFLSFFIFFYLFLILFLKKLYVLKCATNRSERAHTHFRNRELRAVRWFRTTRAPGKLYV